VSYIQASTQVTNQLVLDVGCGGGILSEALAQESAIVTGIDASAQAIFAAKKHMQFEGLKIDYLCTTAEDFAEQHRSEYDIITCMELLEHVPQPASILKACAAMLKPGGSLYLSTLNRTSKSWALGIFAAEYLLNVVPRGTHQHTQFIRPSEIFAWCSEIGLKMSDLIGLHYNPLSNSFRLGPGVDVNYLVRCQRI